MQYDGCIMMYVHRKCVVLQTYENGTMKGMFDMGRAKTDRHGAKAGDWIKYVI